MRCDSPGDDDILEPDRCPQPTLLISSNQLYDQTLLARSGRPHDGGAAAVSALQARASRTHRRSEGRASSIPLQVSQELPALALAGTSINWPPAQLPHELQPQRCAF